MADRLYVALTDEVWEPTEDPDWWRAVNLCDDRCHHPVHAWHPERRHHLEEAAFIVRCGVPVDHEEETG